MNEKRIIYKYRDWKNEYHKRLLINKEIFFADVRDFNDPFDDAIPFQFKNFTEEDLINHQLNLVQNRPFISNQRDKEKLIELIKGEYNETNLARYEKNNKTMFQNMFRVFCASMTPQNIQQWSYYANNHKGFCLGLNIDKLNLDRPYIFKVNYSNDFPQLSPNDSNQLGNFQKAFCTKASNWRHEEEVRIISSRVKGAYCFNPLALEEIYLGLRACKIDKEEICNAAIKLNPDVKVFYMEKEEYKFQLKPLLRKS